MQQYRSFYELANPTVHSEHSSSSSAPDAEEFISRQDESRYIAIIRETWEAIQPRKDEFGTILYEEVVNVNIEISTLFANTRFENQKVAFVHMMGSSVNWLDDFSTWNGKMAPLAQRHVSYGVKPAHYKYFRKAFLITIRQFLDPWTDEREDAWIWYWSCIMNTLGFATQSTLFETVAVPLGAQVRQVTILHATWEHIKDDPMRFGDLFYQKLLTDNTSEMNELFAATDMRRQGVRFFSMLNHAIRQMDDLVGFENDMIKMTYQHKVFGVELEQVDVFGRIFHATLEEILGDGYNAERREAVNWFWGRVRECFEYGLAHTHHFADDTKDEASSDRVLMTDARPFRNLGRVEMDTSENESRSPRDSPEPVRRGEKSLGGVDLQADISQARIFQSMRTLQTRR